MKSQSLFCSIAIALIAFSSAANGQALSFLDDFQDGNEQDGTPGTWTDSAEAVHVLNGDLVITGATDRGRTSLSELAGTKNVSFQTQVQFSSISGNHDAFVAFARSGDDGSYFGELTSEGLLAFGMSRPNGSVNTWSILETGLDPVAHDMRFGFEVIEDQISLRVWPVGTPMPKLPQLTRRNRAITEGADIGAIVIANIRAGVGSASVSIPYVFLSNRPSNDADVSAAAIRKSSSEAEFDLNKDGMVTHADREYWVATVQLTYFGDSNLDGEFNSSDLVQIFQAAEYEDDLAGNSTWATGDWNGDAEFDSADLVVAFQEAGYEKGPRVAAQHVPEPNNSSQLIVAMLVVLTHAIRRQTLDVRAVEF